MLRRNGLLQIVRPLLDTLVVNRKQMNGLTQEIFKKHNVFPDEIIQYATKMQPLDKIKDEMLFWIVESGNALGYVKVDLTEYYTEKEIDLYKALKANLKEESFYPVVIPNLLPVAYDQWVTIIDVDTLYKWYQQQFITYNPRTQRQLRAVGKGENIRYTINVVKKSVLEIEKAMERGQFIANDISLNINVDNPIIEYDVEEDYNDIVIHKGQVDLIDGYHRFLAAINIKIRNPEFKFNFIVNIMNFDEEKACHFIAQEDKRNPILKSVAASMDATNYTNLVVKRLNEMPESVFHEKLARPGLGEIDSTLMVAALEIFYPEAKTNRNYAMGLPKKINDITSTVKEIYDLNLSKDEDLMCLIAASSLTENGYEASEYIKQIKKSPEFEKIMEKRQGVNRPAKLRKLKQLLKGREG